MVNGHFFIYGWPLWGYAYVIETKARRKSQINTLGSLMRRVRVDRVI